MRSLLVVVVLFATVLLIYAGCTPADPPVSKEELIAREVARRTRQWEAGWEARCWEEVYAEASRRADSIIIERVRREQFLLHGAHRLGRPPVPMVDFPTDTIPLMPLLRDTSWFDSLLQQWQMSDSVSAQGHERY